MSERLSDEALVQAYQESEGRTLVERLRSVELAVRVKELSQVMDEDGMYAHVVVPVDKYGRGPATEKSDFDHWACWCGDPECIVGKYGPRPEWLMTRFYGAE